MNIDDTTIGLVCPLDGKSLVAAENRLECIDGHNWKIVDSIPRLVSEGTHYSTSFGLQWRTYRKTQLDSHTGVRLSYERARRCLGERIWEELHGPAPYHVLEVGCGAGRFTEVLLRSPCAHVFSVDASDAVEAHRLNFPRNDRLHVFQADVARLPFPPHQFDLVFCLGVVQHTPWPEKTIARLYRHVRPGGALVLDHYRLAFGSFTTFGVMALRPFVKRLRPKTALRFTRMLVGILLPLHRAVSNVSPLRVLLSRVTPVVTYFHLLPELKDELQREWALLDTHDTLTAWYLHRLSASRIERILKNLGAVDVQVAPGGNGVEARCRRPAPTPAD